MNRGKILISMLVIVVALGLAFGATMAFFTDDIQAPTNTFQAGTVEIENGQEIVTPADMGNVNPGDCFEKCFTIINTGSKAIELRMTGLTGVWSFDGVASGLPLLYEDGPLYIAPVGDDWKMRRVGDGFEFYYTGGPIASGEEVQLCIIVAFDGPKMDDRYQGITLELNGTFDAVQASNDAPESVWSDANWVAWNEPGGWFSLNHYDALVYSMGAAYANYYDTTKCFNGNGGNGGDPDPKLTIVKELLDANGETVASSDVDFTATVTGGEGAFETGQDFTFSVDNPRVLGPGDDLEFDVEYTVTEQVHSDYLFVSINPTTFTLTEASNEVTVTVVNQEKVTNGSGGNETAYAGEIYFGPGQGGGWWRLFKVEDGLQQNIYAGNSNPQNSQPGTVIGTVSISEPFNQNGNDKVTITINLDADWSLQVKDEAVKIQGHASAPSSFQAPGNFNTYKGNELTVTVDSFNYYVIHLDVTGP